MRRGFEGRVSVGHATNLSATTPDELEALGKQLAKAGIAVTALHATDLFLMGREVERLTPRGVAPVHRLAALGDDTLDQQRAELIHCLRRRILDANGQPLREYCAKSARQRTSRGFST
jgi:hypothetical protein